MEHRQLHFGRPNDPPEALIQSLAVSNNGELSCMFALITGDNVEFNLRADHGLHELVRDWLLDSTAPVL